MYTKTKTQGNAYHKQKEVHKTMSQQHQQSHRLRTDSSLSHWGP